MTLSSLGARLLGEYTATHRPNARVPGPSDAEDVLSQDVAEQSTQLRKHVAPAVDTAGVTRFGARKERLPEHTGTGGGRQLAEGQDLSLITATYGQEGGTTGTLGLIAPTRTDYQKVVPLVGFAADLLTNLLEKKH